MVRESIQHSFELRQGYRFAVQREAILPSRCYRSGRAILHCNALTVKHNLRVRHGDDAREFFRLKPDRLRSGNDAN
jgi:hypothetical protein